MLVTVQIPTPLRRFCLGQNEVELAGTTISDILEKFCLRFPDLAVHLYDENGVLRNFLNVYLNDEDIRYLNPDDCLLKDGDTLMIVPAVAGGSVGVDCEHPDNQDFSPNELTNEEIERYSRQLLLPEISICGQEKLKSARVLCVGVGGLGSPVAMYLAAAGVGCLGLVDFDVVDVTNMQRQIIHCTENVGRPKLQSAKEAIERINPHVQVELFDVALFSGNALEIFRTYDVIVDGTDNFPARYLVNDACVMLGKPYVYGSISKFEGQVSIFASRGGPCHRCLYPEPPPHDLIPSCAEGGVLGVVPGIIGVLQATETLKLVLGIGKTLIGRLLLFDALLLKFKELRLQKDPNCPICGERRTIDKLIDYERVCGIGKVGDEQVPAISAKRLYERVIQSDKICILDVREPHEFEICHIAGATLIPLGQLSSRFDELDGNFEIITCCRSGLRGAKAVEILKAEGFTKVANLIGGIAAWSDGVDPSMAKY